ncbi:anthranilate synthase component I [Aliinostoc sp. HNIBRCY26]|uniref:anthranilate synthase component I n=1 Tax=Aliinostoc sp. HNIBRCY26 TaxID=3418997 RepID=UPI003CFEC0B9
MWYWRSLPLENRTGAEIFSALFYPHTTSQIATLLESPYPTPTNQPQLSRYSICAGAPRRVNGVPQMWTPALGGIFPLLEELLLNGGQGGQGRISPLSPLSTPSTLSPPSPPPHLPFTGGWLGWLGYDAAWEIEGLPYTKPDTLPFPVAFWYQPEDFAVLDHVQQVLWLAASDAANLDELELRLRRTNTENSVQHITPVTNYPVTPEFLTSQLDYEAAVNRAKKYIQAGDIFQANLSLRFSANTSARGWAIYQALHKINPSPFASYWRTPWGEVISCSPERLVLLENTQAQTRPIAGTRSRGITQEQDQQLAKELLSNTKERAEHIMLVDLERNDLGRVCEWGTVTVDELLTIERYSHVMHLVSNVTGQLRSDRTPIDLTRALFPGGTITGCPKVRCMEIIEELEPVRRSLFYGSCGYLDWRGNLDLNIFIRTLLLTPNAQSNTVWGQVGAGIVADSDPEKEWYESLHKAQAQLAALKMVN